MYRGRETGIIGKLTCALLAAALFVAPAVRADAAAGFCARVHVPVALGPGQPRNQIISGSLCAPNGYAGGVHRVDLLVHGGTYNSAYWNWPLDPDRYSYVRKTVNAGRATFAFDRLGDGGSSRPPSTSLTIAADVYVLHRLIQWLHGKSFAQVTVIGHSLGSMVSIAEAASYKDADRLVVTGVMHPPGLGARAPLLFGSFYPAVLDPQFAGRHIDAGYLTTLPRTRADSFYDPAAADFAVIAYDEAHKDLISSTEFDEAAYRLTIPAGLNDTNHVAVPVLVMVGADDALVCGLLVDCSHGENVRANEAPYYASAASLTGATIRDTGHSLPLHPSSTASFTIIDQWITSH
jgi:pimeloyl-ACP methyl ester carboxylesterase